MKTKFLGTDNLSGQAMLYKLNIIGVTLGGPGFNLCRTNLENCPGLGIPSSAPG